MNVADILINLMLFVLLPLWGIAGMVDWFCHRATKIETTSGVFETCLHSIMGIQIAIPIGLCILFRVNVLVMLICIAAWLLHEVIAHVDVRYASPRREISIWEMHAHSYLSTLPIYMLLIISALNWDVVVKLVSLDWQSSLYLERIETPHGGSWYLPAYLGFMLVVCVFPYMEENFRCISVWYKKRYT